MTHRPTERGGRAYAQRVLYDVIIIGGGPAGLSAALVLGRCRRKVLVFDDGRPRNRWAARSHNFLTRDGVPPMRLLELGRAEVMRYGVEVREGHVERAACCRLDPRRGGQRTAFEVQLADGSVYRSQKLLLATGVRDVLPDVPGLRDFYGKGVHHCPYCDGYEYADKRLVALGEDAKTAVGLAVSLRTWSERVTACTNGVACDAELAERAERNGIAVRCERIVRLEGRKKPPRLQRIVFEDGDAIGCEGLFFNTGQYQKSDLPAQLGCEFQDDGKIVTQGKQHTCVSGLYLAGDADGDVQFVIVAAAEGATAATAINRDLQDEDRGMAEPIRDAWRFTEDRVAPRAPAV